MSAGLEILYLVRHGKAVGSHPDGDRHRALSTEGRRRIELMGPVAAAKDFRAELALSSPYLRAVQTRDLFQQALSATRTELSAVFTPDSDPREALEELETWQAKGVARIAGFTHNPFVTALAELLLVPGSVPDLVFHTPTILALEFPSGLAPRQGRPLWILHP